MNWNAVRTGARFEENSALRTTTHGMNSMMSLMLSDAVQFSASFVVTVCQFLMTFVGQQCNH